MEFLANIDLLLFSGLIVGQFVYAPVPMGIGTSNKNPNLELIFDDKGITAQNNKTSVSKRYYFDLSKNDEDFKAKLAKKLKKFKLTENYTFFSKGFENKQVFEIEEKFLNLIIQHSYKGFLKPKVKISTKNINLQKYLILLLAKSYTFCL